MMLTRRTFALTPLGLAAAATLAACSSKSKDEATEEGKMALIVSDAGEAAAEPEAATGGRRIPVPRGRMLGGSSSMNAMCYTRGHAFDYDHWAALGNRGWSYAEVLPYFKRSENQERGASEYHGTGGPLNVMDFRQPNVLTERFLEAAQQAGFTKAQR